MDRGLIVTDYPETDERLITCLRMTIPEGKIQNLWREAENLDKLAEALDFRLMSQQR